MYKINKDAGISNRGNLARIKQVMQRAQEGEQIVLAFLGGSITQGCLSSRPETCYAYLTYKWWEKMFPKAEIVYVNAGIGGTTSQFGVARVEEDVLAHRPDLVIVEFSVNDDSNEFFLETYESLVRKIYASETRPAIFLVHNVYYDSGKNAQIQHAKVARHYDLPAVSMQSSIYPAVVSGEIENREITPDDLHPNDAGHELVASVITNYMEKILEEVEVEEIEKDELPAPMTLSAYEDSKRYQNHNSMPESNGFEADQSEQRDITDCFKHGWIAKEKGASITFKIKGSGIAIQYCKTIKRPAPVAKVVIDGCEEQAVRLDVNFDEEWGDCLYIETIARHIEDREHMVKIEITEIPEGIKSPFYLVSVIGS